VGNTQILELLARARGDPNHRRSALCKCAAADFSNPLDHRVGVRRLEARVQQVGHFPDHGRITAVQAVERLAQTRLVSSEMPDQSWEQRVVGVGGLTLAREDRRHQATQGLDGDPRNRATVPLDQASGQMLAQASRGCDHEHRPAERGWIRDPRACEPAEFLEEVRFGGNRTAQHEDPTDDSSLSHPARRTPLSRGPSHRLPPAA